MNDTTNKKIKFTRNETLALMKSIKQHVNPSGYISFKQILDNDDNKDFHDGRTASKLGDKWKRLKKKYKDAFGTVVTKDEIIKFCKYIEKLENEGRGPRHVYQSSPHSSEGVLKMEVRPPKDWLVM